MWLFLAYIELADNFSPSNWQPANWQWIGRQLQLGAQQSFGHESKACKKPNHFASVCKSSQKRPIKQLTELSDEEQETDTDTDTNEFFYKVEEVSSVQARGKQFYAPLEFCDPDAGYKTKLDCQLDTGATCNVLTHRDLSEGIRRPKYQLPTLEEVLPKPKFSRHLTPRMDSTKLHYTKGAASLQHSGHPLADIAIFGCHLESMQPPRNLNANYKNTSAT